MRGEGIFFLMAGPAATGKTTVLGRLLERAEGLARVLSVTTRRPRPGEADGRDYHFWDRERFQAAVAHGEFLEHAVVHGADWYGTLKAPVERVLADGLDAIKEVDVQGAAQVRRVWPFPRTVLIFLVPPGPEDLLARFRDRGTEDQEAQRRRLESAKREVQHIGEYDYLVYNDTVEQTVADLLAIRRAEHCRRARREADFARRWR
jgi:guanylate kinase